MLYNIHHGVLGTSGRLHKLNQTINIPDKSKLIQCIETKEYIYIYISPKWSNLDNPREGVLEKGRRTYSKFRTNNISH